MKKCSLHKIIMLMAALVVSVLLSGKTVSAADYNLNLDDNYVWGNISTPGVTDFYTFRITKPSLVTITYQGHSIRDSYFSIHSYDQAKEYYKREVWTSSDESPITATINLSLEAGTYIVKVWSYGNNTGRYRLKANARAYENNEIEPNNGFTNAMSLTNDIWVRGLLSNDDRIDFYKISVSAKQNLRLMMVSRISDIYVDVYDGDFQHKEKHEIYTASEDSPKTAEYKLTLDPGVYYVKITPYYSGTGTYDIKFKRDIIVSSISMSGKNSVVLGKNAMFSATIYPSNATEKEVEWTTSNSSIASVDENGYLTTYSAGKVIITATAKDGSNARANKTIIVTPKKTDAPYVSNYHGKKLYVSWYTQQGSSGYQVQYGTKSNFKGAKTLKVAKTKNSKLISKLKKNKKYYVRVRSYTKIGSKTYYGSWSTKRSVKIIY